MTSLQLSLLVGIPSVLVLVAILVNNARSAHIETRLELIELHLRRLHRTSIHEEAADAGEEPKLMR